MIATIQMVPITGANPNQSWEPKASSRALMWVAGPQVLLSQEHKQGAELKWNSRLIWDSDVTGGHLSHLVQFWLTHDASLNVSIHIV